MGDGSIQLIAVVILIACSALFSATETAFLSFNKTRMKNAASDGDKRAALVMKLSDNYDSLLSTILIGNNIVNIAIASIMTAMCLEAFAANGTAISTLISTVAVLIFGEVTPKSLAKEFADSFVKLVAPLFNLLTLVFTPLSFFFSLLKRGMSKLLGAKEEVGMTEDELITLVEEAEQDGGINESEGNLIRSAIEFEDVEVKDIMTPRVEIVAVWRDDSLEEITKTFRESGFSRLPVYGDTVDSIVGVLHEKDFFHFVDDGGTDITKILRRAIYIPCHIKISKLLSLFQQEKAHMAIVLDDYGGTLGIATLEDVLEELVGDIWDEHDEIVQLIRPEADGSLTAEGGAKLSDIFEYFDLEPDDDDLPQTVNGWVMTLAGDLPEVGTELEGEGMLVRVLETDGKLVGKVSISRIDEADEEK